MLCACAPLSPLVFWSGPTCPFPAARLQLCAGLCWCRPLCLGCELPRADCRTHASGPWRAGRRKSVCPYYSARRALPEADIVLAPYSCLLAKETRQALGLRLEGNVVVIDEGHNLGKLTTGPGAAGRRG